MFLALACAFVVFAYAFIGRPSERAHAAVRPAMKSATNSTANPLVRSDPGIDPWVERNIPSPKPKVLVKPEATPTPAPAVDPQAASVPKPTKQPNPRPEQQKGTKSTGENNPPQTPEQAYPANHASHYHLPKGAIMSLTIPSIGLKEVPVLDSDTRGALDRGVVHLPDTSMPWSDTTERNVYLAGHRLGWPGTESHLVFYRLDELSGGERITLQGKEGRKYDYRVIESSVVGPEDDWVTGRVRGRDLLTLQTCTPIPTFEWRLIVRAERI